jgi:hypothetical protein
MMKIWGTNVYNRSGGQVINIEDYQPGWDLYWEVTFLDPTVTSGSTITSMNSPSHS